MKRCLILLCLLSVAATPPMPPGARPRLRSPKDAETFVGKTSVVPLFVSPPPVLMNVKLVYTVGPCFTDQGWTTGIMASTNLVNWTKGYEQKYPVASGDVMILVSLTNQPAFCYYKAFNGY